MMHQWDADVAQLCRWTDAREQQQMWGFQAPGAEYDLLPRHGKDISAALDLYSYRPRALEEDAPGQSMGPDGQVQPVTGWIER
jgi:hypothetical protein